MNRAQKRDAVLDQHFWFRRKFMSQNLDTLRSDVGVDNEMRTGSREPNIVDDEWDEISMDEIFNGKVSLNMASSLLSEAQRRVYRTSFIRV